MDMQKSWWVIEMYYGIVQVVNGIFDTGYLLGLGFCYKRVLTERRLVLAAYNKYAVFITALLRMPHNSYYER